MRFDFFCLFFFSITSEKPFFHQKRHTPALSRKRFKTHRFPSLWLFFTKHHHHHNNNEQKKKTEKKNGPTGDDGTFRARIQRGFGYEYSRRENQNPIRFGGGFVRDDASRRALRRHGR